MAGTKLKIVRFFAVVFVALALVPGGAHLSELPNKITMPPDQYMVVQQIYRGWALFGIVVFAALIFTGAHTLLVRSEPTALRLSLTAFLCLAAAQAIFWIFTFPMNVASADWSKIPDHFEAARRQWEYSHAAGAALTLVALFALIGSLLRADPRARARRPSAFAPGALPRLPLEERWARAGAPRAPARSLRPATPTLAPAHAWNRRGADAESAPLPPSYLLSVVATNSGSSWARRSKERKS